MASAVAHRLARCGLRVAMTELPRPLAIRRRVCFSEATYDRTATVEGVTARLVAAPDRFEECWKCGEIPLLIDPSADVIDSLQPDVVVDGVMAKRNVGTRLSHAPLVIGLGPGFEAGADVHVVIETNRGHRLGTIIACGCAEPNTGRPGNVFGYEMERVSNAPDAGIFAATKQIGAMVEEGETIGVLGESLVRSKIKGVLRGIIRDGTPVAQGTKLADVDPRCQLDYCTTISDKAKTISGSVLEAILMYYNL
jgi:xanthine dehydrogenase accessory factor